MMNKEYMYKKIMSKKDSLLENYYSPKIQLHKNVINNILDEMIDKNRKVLVFGLGFDSRLWYEANDKKNIYFIEDHKHYIKLNDFLDEDQVIHHVYRGITVKDSFSRSEEMIENNYKVPEELKKLGTFDLIIIDAPVGCVDNRPGRMIPIHWAVRHLSRPGTIIYIDDSARPLESFCIERYCKDMIVKTYPERKETTKCIM